MKYLLSIIFPIALLISCEKEDRNFETAHKLISFFPGISQTDTRTTDGYPLSDYFAACSTVTVRMITGNKVNTATYRYNADTKKLEYADGTPLYYPEDDSSYQLILSWPDEATHAQFGEADYRHQEDKNSFMRCDRLSDIVNNAVGVEYLPIYFKHVKSMLTFILVAQSSKQDIGAVSRLTVNGYKSFHNTANPYANVFQLIYDSSIEAKTTDITNNKVVLGPTPTINEDEELEYHFRFDASLLKPGENREIKITVPLLSEFKNNL